MMKIVIRNLLIGTFLSFGSIEASVVYHLESKWEGQSFSHIPYDDLEKIKEAINSAIEAQKDDDDEAVSKRIKKLLSWVIPDPFI